MPEEKKEFEEWWNTQIDSLDYATSLYTDEQFSLEQMKKITCKAWKESKRQELERPLPPLKR